jgi:hypothetical protein
MLYLAPIRAAPSTFSYQSQRRVQSSPNALGGKCGFGPLAPLRGVASCHIKFLADVVKIRDGGLGAYPGGWIYPPPRKTAVTTAN